MTRKHLELASKLWSLALIAQSEEGVVSGVPRKIRSLAAKRAQTKLSRLGVSSGEIPDEDAAYAVAARILGIK